jgi:hypothetical protein
MTIDLMNASPSWLFCIVLISAMIGMALLGFRLRPQKPFASLGAFEGAVFGLLGLLLAFTFGMSASRYDSRRLVIVEEANKITTAYLRSSMYVDSVRDELRKNFKGYLEARIAYHDAYGDSARCRAANDSAASYASRLWAIATTQSRNPANLSASNQMIPGLNLMLDIAVSRDAALHAQIPNSIIYLLFILALCCSFFVGISACRNNKMNWPIIIGFCLLVMCVVYTILDLDRPYRGFIRSDQNETYIRAIRKIMQ